MGTPSKGYDSPGFRQKLKDRRVGLPGREVATKLIMGGSACSNYDVIVLMTVLLLNKHTYLRLNLAGMLTWLA